MDLSQQTQENSPQDYLDLVDKYRKSAGYAVPLKDLIRSEKLSSHRSLNAITKISLVITIASVMSAFLPGFGILLCLVFLFFILMLCSFGRKKAQKDYDLRSFKYCSTMPVFGCLSIPLAAIVTNLVVQ